MRGSYFGTMMAAAAMFGAGVPFDPMPQRKETPLITCGLPECNEKSYKSYCCKEHCMEHRARQKMQREALCR